MYLYCSCAPWWACLHASNRCVLIRACALNFQQLSAFVDMCMIVMALWCMCAYLGQYWTLAWRRRGTRCCSHVSGPSHAIGLYWGIFPHTCVYRERVRKKEWETSSTLPNLTLTTIILQALSWWPQESKQFVSNLRININTPQKGSNLQWVAIMTLYVPSGKVVSCVSFVLFLSSSVYSSTCACMYICVCTWACASTVLKSQRILGVVFQYTENIHQYLQSLQGTLISM